MNMKRLVLVLICVICTLTMMGQEHLMFKHIPIDGSLKSGMKQVRKMGFWGFKIDNMGMLMGDLDGEEVMLTLIATPKTKTLFCIAVMYDGYNTWEEAMARFDKLNAPLVQKYGEAKEIIDEWEEPYSRENNPIEAFKQDKGEYGLVYAAPEGEISLALGYDDGKLGVMIIYVDQQNYDLFEAEGGDENELNF